MGVDVMIILYLEVLLGICLIAVELVMLHNIKKSNDIWWRTYWAKDKVMMDKINEINSRQIITTTAVCDEEWAKEFCKKYNIKSLADF
jgi:hypothetical protein